MPSKFSVWKQRVIVFAGAWGAPGLFLISFLDSSVLSFPVINDLLLIQLSIDKPSRMPLYAAAATLGSVLGCVLLYFIARTGGEAFFEKNAGVHGVAVRHWVEQNGFVGVLLAASDAGVFHAKNPTLARSAQGMGHYRTVATDCLRYSLRLGG